MTNRLDELRGLIDAATPGPWSVYHQGDDDGPDYERSHSISSDGAPDADWIVSTSNWHADEHRQNADLIVFLRNHAEDLLAVAVAAQVFATTWIDGKCAYCLALSSLPEPCHHETASGAASLRQTLARLSPTSEEGS